MKIRTEPEPTRREEPPTILEIKDRIATTYEKLVDSEAMVRMQLQNAESSLRDAQNWAWNNDDESVSRAAHIADKWQDEWNEIQTKKKLLFYLYEPFAEFETWMRWRANEDAAIKMMGE